MHTTAPTITSRDELRYVGIRMQVTMDDLDAAIPDLIAKTADRLAEHGVEPTGPPLVRYHVIDMDALLDITIGFPVPEALADDEFVAADALPAGRYASLIYTGVENGIRGNGALIDWIAAQGLAMDRWDDERGDAFAGRVEHLLDGPDDDPDPSRWRTEVAIRLTDR